MAAKEFRSGLPPVALTGLTRWTPSLRSGPVAMVSCSRLEQPIMSLATVCCRCRLTRSRLCSTMWLDRRKNPVIFSRDRQPWIDPPSRRRPGYSRHACGVAEARYAESVRRRAYCASLSRISTDSWPWGQWGGSQRAR